MLNARGVRSFTTAVVLLLLPAMALAEVSVLVDRKDGTVKKILYLRGGRSDRAKVIWSQVRPGIPLEVMLNPLGDNLGDLEPTIRTHPATGTPWVVWPANEANVKRLVVSRWGRGGWTPRAHVIAQPGPIPYDEIHPDFAFDEAGTPLLVWERAEPAHSVLFSTPIDGTWTPPMRLSQEGVDSRRPRITLSGTKATVSFETPDGLVEETYEIGSLLESAARLMDGPLPPGETSDGGSNPPSSGGGGDESHDTLMPR